MKVYNIIVSALLLSSMVSCDGNDTIPEIPEQTTEGYQFTFDGSTDTDEEATRASWTDISTDDKGTHLVFGWDYTDKNKPVYDMKMAFINPNNGTSLASNGKKNYTDVTIMKHSTKGDDRHWAEFKTVERYEKELKAYDGHTLIAVNGKGSTVKTSPYAIELTMPATFTQSAANSLDHLSDYMYMYATDTIKNGDATGLQFKHLTAPVRFRIHNWRPSEAKIYSVSMNVANDQSLASSTVSVGTNGTTYSSAHSAITVKAADNAPFSIAERTQKEYIDLYAHILPMSSSDGLKGKTIQFTIEANDIVTGEEKVQYLTSELDHIDAEKFYKATGSYNWIAGDLYTFHIYLDDAIKGVTIESVSIKEWENENLPDSETM